MTTKRVYAPHPNGKRILVAKAQMAPVILKGSGLEVKATESLIEAEVISLGTDAKVQVQAESLRDLRVGDVVLFNPKVTGQDVSQAFGEVSGSLYVIFDGDVVLGRAIEDPEAGTV